MTQGFGASVVMGLTGVSRMQLQHWDNTGMIKPSLRRGNGKGSRRTYSFKDIVALKVASGLRREGIGLQKIRAVVDYLRKNCPDASVPLSELRFVTNGLDIFVITDDRDVLLDCLRNQLVFSFAIGEVMGELKGALKTLQKTHEIKFKIHGRQYTAILESDLQDGGYTVTCSEIPAAISQGETVEEAIENITDAVELCLEHIESPAIKVMSL